MNPNTEKSFNLCSHALPLLWLSCRSSLSKDAHKYFDADTGVLEVPVVLQIAGQVCFIGYYIVYQTYSKSSCNDCVYIHHCTGQHLPYFISERSS